MRAADIEVNDRILLPPFDLDRGGRAGPSGDSRYVMAIDKWLPEGYVVVTLDGLAPRTLPSTLEVLLIARGSEIMPPPRAKPEPLRPEVNRSRAKRDWLKHGVYPHTKVGRRRM